MKFYEHPQYDESWEVPNAEYYVFGHRSTKYCIVIPVINENGRISRQLGRMKELGIPAIADIIIADGGSTDGSVNHNSFNSFGVRAIIVVDQSGQSSQLRAGYAFALSEGYEGIITVDGNNKDSVESIPQFIAALESGIAYVQGSRFITGGSGINTPPLRSFAIRFISVPLVSLAARRFITDTTNAFRAYQRSYLLHPDVRPFRSIFRTYELHFYLGARASRLGLSVMEIPVIRKYPAKGALPTKISPIAGKFIFLKIMFLAILGYYNPKSR